MKRREYKRQGEFSGEERRWSAPTSRKLGGLKGKKEKTWQADWRRDVQSSEVDFKKKKRRVRKETGTGGVALASHLFSGNHSHEKERIYIGRTEEEMDHEAAWSIKRREKGGADACAFLAACRRVRVGSARRKKCHIAGPDM